MPYETVSLWHLLRHHWRCDTNCRSDACSTRSECLAITGVVASIVGIVGSLCDGHWLDAFDFIPDELRGIPKIYRSRNYPQTS